MRRESSFRLGFRTRGGILCQTSVFVTRLVLIMMASISNRQRLVFALLRSHRVVRTILSDKLVALLSRTEISDQMHNILRPRPSILLSCSGKPPCK